MYYSLVVYQTKLRSDLSIYHRSNKQHNQTQRLQQEAEHFPTPLRSAMVSTVQPSRRHKKKGDNKSIQNHQHNNHNSSGKSKKRKEQQPTLVSSQKGNFQISSLYTEDLGLEGVKRAKVTCTQKPGPILKGPEGPNFSISETPEERLRRLRRKV